MPASAHTVMVNYLQDVGAPSVTINQGAVQADPTYLMPIVYDVVFSEPVTGFTSSDVSVRGTARGTKKVVIAGSGSTYTVSVSGMSSSGTVIASVKALAAEDGAGNKSTASTSTDNTVTYTKPAIPGKPVLNKYIGSPANKELLTTYTPTFTWGASNPEAVSYYLQVSTSKRFTTRVIDQADILETNFTAPTALSPGLRYYWRVRGVNIAGVAGKWSSVRYFMTPLSTPVLLTPGDGESLLTDVPTFDWEDVSGATRYIIQIASRSTFSKTVVKKTITSSEYIPTRDLPQNTLLYWRVKATTAYVSSDWSEVRTFTTGNPPSVPRLYKPNNKALTKDYTPLLDWRNSKVAHWG